MGFFSFLTQDTDRSISNVHSKRIPFTIYMHDNKGNIWQEDDYEGYGIFGGKDFHELLAEMNGENDRDDGIDLEFSGPSDTLKPQLTESSELSPNTDFTIGPEHCEYQGFFY